MHPLDIASLLFFVALAIACGMTWGPWWGVAVVAVLVVMELVNFMKAR